MAVIGSQMQGGSAVRVSRVNISAGCEQLGDLACIAGLGSG
jgi:hypothetical protein